ncbi:lysozyme inhibitor LprI family protein [Pseudovibrio ascidiaceicola]|uniref:lysozyme inhibitor LprI family protein n=1 Tax=Pseudovibrio ascidiaceicola TaxID=285279 RepID=UPI003D36AE16
MRQPDPDHIIEWKERRRLQSRPISDVQLHLGQLKDAWNNSSDSYLREFIPMRISTCIEVYVRETVQELVDLGEPYSEAASKLVRNAKLDLLFATHLAGKKLSVGDFVAHAVSINSIEAVLSSLSTLIVDFTSRLKTAHPRWDEEVSSWPLKPIIDDFDETISILAKMFEVRHILTHELPDASIVKDLDIDQLCEAATTFVEACDWVVLSEQHNSVPRTQIAMNISAGEKMREVEDEVKILISEAKDLSGISEVSLANVQKHWQEFATAEANLFASQVEGGSLQPLMFAEAMIELSKDRAKQLRRLIDEWYDD